MLDINLRTKKIILFLGDIGLMYVCLMATLYLRYGNELNRDIRLAHIIPFTVIFILLTLIFYINELYEIEFTRGRLNIITKLISGYIAGSVISIAFFYFGYNRLFSIRPQRVFFIFLAISFVLTYLCGFFFF